MRPATVLLVGLGQIGMGYDIDLPSDSFVLSHARAFHLNPDFLLAGAVDPDPLKREAFSRLYFSPAFSDLDEALQALSPKVVVIATPTDRHLEVVGAVTQAKTPDFILCEKPLANDLIDAQKVVDACKENGKRLFVNYIRRADSAVLTIKEMLEAREIVGPFTGIASYGEDIVHNGTHMLDLLAFWFGFPNADSSRIGPKRIDGRSPVYIKYDSGEVMLKEPGHKSDSFDIVLHFSNGILNYADEEGSVTWTSAHECRRIEGSMNFYQEKVSQEISLALRGGRTSLSSGDEAMQSLRTALRIVEKAWKQ